tara:strand:+ start:40 stop:600 length:561 start_codon:yes stop_codon:yes gene_type:complete
MTANHIFTVLTRNPLPTGGDILSRRQVVSDATTKKSSIEIKDYDKEKETITVRKDSKEVLKKQQGIAEEMVRGATFRWEHIHNSKRHLVKDVVTLKELNCVIDFTNLSEDSDINDFADNLNAAAQPSSTAKTVETELTTVQMQSIYRTSHIFEKEGRFREQAPSAEVIATITTSVEANLPPGITIS